MLPESLTFNGLAVLAPYVLSDEGWELVRDDAASGLGTPWANFKEAVEKHFGIPPASQRRQLFCE